MLTDNKLLLDNADASDDITSGALQLVNVWGFAIQAVITGSPVGTLKLQGSCDVGSTIPGNPSAGAGVVNWTDIADSSQDVTGAGSVTWDVTRTAYRWVRIVYTATSGTGNISARENSKGA